MNTATLLPIQMLERALPEHPKFSFQVLSPKRNGVSVVVEVRDGVFADGEKSRRVFIPYKAIRRDVELQVRMIVDTSEHALEW